MFEAGEYTTDVLYRDQLRENVLVKQYYLDVDIAHLISFTEETAHKLNTEPAEIIPLVCLKRTLIRTIIALTTSSVRSGYQEMHAAHCLPFRKG